MGHFIKEIKKHLVAAAADTAEQQTIFVFCRNVLVNSSALMSHVYERYKSDDGFLYLKYSAENVFGGDDDQNDDDHNDHNDQNDDDRNANNDATARCRACKQ